MGGCGNAGAKGGCDDRKSPMFAAMESTLARLYPTRTWGEPHGVELGAGMAFDDLTALADAGAVSARVGGR